MKQKTYLKSNQNYEQIQQNQLQSNKDLIQVMTEIAEVNKKLVSIIINIIESYSKSEASVKVKLVIKFIKSKEYKKIQN